MRLMSYDHYTNRSRNFPYIHLFYRQEFLSPVLQAPDAWIIPHTVNIFKLYIYYDYTFRKIVDQQSFQGLDLLLKALKAILHIL